MTTRQEWLDKRVAEIRMRKRPSKAQKELVRLAGISDRSEDETETLKLLIATEKQADVLIDLQSKAHLKLKSSRELIQSRARTERTHELAKAAGLMGLAGLLNKQTGVPMIEVDVLVGALQSLSRVTSKDKRWNDWKVRGAALLSEASVRSKRKVLATPVIESNGPLEDQVKTLSQAEASAPAAAAATHEQWETQGLI